MLKLTEQECIEKIESGECFHTDIEGGFQLKIEKYSFYVCTAIHDGHNLREDLQNNCLLDNTLYFVEHERSDFEQNQAKYQQML